MARRIRRDYKGAAEWAGIVANVQREDDADARTDDELRAEIERLRADIRECQAAGYMNVVSSLIDQLCLLRGRLERRVDLLRARP